MAATLCSLAAATAHATQTRVLGRFRQRQHPPVSAGSAAWSVQVPGTGAGALQAAGVGGRLGSEELPGEALDRLLPALTRAAAHRLVYASRVEKAAAALDAMQKEAERAAERSRWVFGEEGRALVHPAEGTTGAKAGAATRSEIMRLFQTIMPTFQPPDNARSAAAALAPEEVAAAAEQAAAASMQTYPLPRRITPKYRRATAREACRSVQCDALDKAQKSRVGGVLAEVARLDTSCIAAAHAAGLSWLALGTGPGLAAGQAWVAELVEVAAGMQGGQERALAILRNMRDVSGGIRARNRELDGGRRVQAPVQTCSVNFVLAGGW